MNEIVLSQAANLLQQKFGSQWKEIVQTLGTEDLRHRMGKELTSFLAFPERGAGGDSQWRGNCSPKVIEAIVRYIIERKQYEGKDISNFMLLDPMSGSGTSQYVADKLGIQSRLYDLNPNPAYGIGGWNALKDNIEVSADFIFFHPPYHSIIKYSGQVWGKPHEDDLSRCESYSEFIEKLNYVIKKLFLALRKDGRIAILVGDIRQKGEFHSIQHDMMKIGKFESFLVKSQFHCNSDKRVYKVPFIPVVTEYVLLYHKPDAFLFTFSQTKEYIMDIRKYDTMLLTWNHLIRMTIESMGGTAALSELYRVLEEHPKSKKNPHYKERIRATIYEHKEQYIPIDVGTYRLCYQVY